ncbi:response regulator [Paenibacillus flagellatus]|uniref:DNA-binding response regulator n=1 Tax=Paenibacillus flagellatus TaxID=2211139 RepID=A0A2V5KV35_9BACL|nr:response regulator [Paenibacillus flagellatus]PYI55927.1 hypothetical protein DLM86_09470 [Paenibacillus flagellatus]
MNVLIVDDEPIIRVGLRTLVDWEEHGFRLVGEASDGEEALEAMKRESVDIVITDIRMPRMDGLALMREIKSRRDDVGMLVLSCLDDFAFVKEAMKLGAYDYVLKPTMEPEELLALLQSVRTKLADDRRTKREIAEWQEQLEQSRAYRLAEWLREYVRTGEGEARLSAELFPPGFGTFSIWVEAGDAGFRPALDEWTIPDSRAVVKWSERTWIVLYGYAKSLSEKERHDLMFGAAQSLLSRIRDNGEGGGTSFVCLGPVIPRIQDFAQAIQYHQRQLHARFYGSADKLVTADPGPVAEGPLPLEERSDFLRAVSNGNREAAVHWMEAAVESIRRHKPNAAKTQSFLRDMLALAYGFAEHPDGTRNGDDGAFSESLDRIRSLSHIEALGEFVVDAARRLWAKPLGDEAGKEPANPFIRKAIRFMREHYGRNIGTVDIADHVKLSRSYLSDLFGKETGESLTETLTRIRIEEAKKKLRSGEMKVYEVAEAVGFADPKSFAKTFKRLVGCTPKEFEAAHK